MSEYRDPGEMVDLDARAERNMLDIILSRGNAYVIENPTSRKSSYKSTISCKK